MANNPFRKAVKERMKLRLAIMGVTGSGKTYTALTIGQRLAELAGGPLAVIDSEHDRARLYGHLFDFDHLSLTNYSPLNYMAMIQAAAQNGYAVVVVDSLSHAWSGEGGTLDMVDAEALRQGDKRNTFGAWKNITPIQRKLIDTIIASPIHVIITMRSKMEYVQEKDERTHKTTIRKVGLKPEQREGLEYEFDIVADMNTDTDFIVTKTRFPEINKAVINCPTAALAETIFAALDGSEPAPVQQAPVSPPATSNGHTAAPMPQMQAVQQAGQASINSKDEHSAFIRRAMQLGYVTEDGKLSLRAVHRALGLPEAPGELKAWVAAGGSWQQAQDWLEDVTLQAASHAERDAAERADDERADLAEAEQAAMGLQGVAVEHAASTKGSH